MQIGCHQQKEIRRGAMGLEPTTQRATTNSFSAAPDALLFDKMDSQLFNSLIHEDTPSHINPSFEHHPIRSQLED